MIDKTALIDVVNKELEGSENFLVDVEISPDNRIVVEIESLCSYVSIDDCAKLTRAIEAAFDRDKEDYELEVGSAGLTSPFKVRNQYIKNLGNGVEVLTKDGQKLKGTLKASNEEDFVVSILVKVKLEGEKRPKMIEEERTFRYDEVKYTKYLIEFK